MEDSAQKVVNLDEEMEKHTGNLLQQGSEQLNKAGFPETPQSLDPQHRSIIEEAKYKIHNLERLARETGEELTTGTQHIGAVESKSLLEMAAQKRGKIAEESKEAA